MVAARKALLFAFLVLTPAMAGCNVKDWYNQMGTVSIHLDVLPTNSTIGDFRSLKAALYGVSLRQFQTTDAKHFSFEDRPEIVDLVAKKGERIPVTQFSTNLRATDRVAVRIAVIEAIDAAGNSLEICRLSDRPERFPCFYQPDNAALLYEEKPFAPPRGGTVEVGFPVAVKYAKQGRAEQYFLFADPDLVILEKHR